jgi:adhesin/invasin
MLRGIQKHTLAGAAIILVAIVTTGCDKVPLTAPTNSTVTLTAPTRTLPLGGTTEVTATVLESGGTPVQNGTTVRFTTTLGSVAPVEVQTRNGVATATFNAGTASGTATIRATSGGAGGTSTTTGGTTTTTGSSNQLDITIGAAAAGRINISATPQSVPSAGGTSQVTATVFDTNGNALPGVPVSFVTDAGTLSQSTVVSDANGIATVTLTTNRQAKVTARVGSGQNAPTADTTVTVNVAGTVTLRCQGTTTTAATTCAQVVNQPVTFTAERGTTTGAAPITSATLDFGDGTSTSLGNLSSTATVSHAYSNTGSFTATLRAVDANGETTTASAVVTVTSPIPIGVNITVTQGTGANVRLFTFTANVTPAAAAELVESYTWDFDDGTKVVTTGNTTSHLYTQSGRYIVTVTVRTTDGRTGNGRTEIVVPSN